MTEAIQLFHIKDMAVEAAPEADGLKEEALALAGLITVVNTEATNSSAFEAQKELEDLRRSVERTRKELKKPILDLGRRLDLIADGYCKELNEESTRIARLIGDYQALKIAKQRAEEASRANEIAEIEKRKQLDLAKVNSLDEHQAVKESYDRQAALVFSLPVQAPDRLKGQTVREDWDITVVDIWLLAKAHPSCVKIEHRLTEIKQLLNAGVKVAGIIASKIVKAGAR